MYDYELEKSLEERQKEELEMNLKRNASNRKFEKKIKLTYAVIALLFAIVVIGFLISRNPDVLIGCGCIVSLISFVIIIVVNKCPHCNRRFWGKRQTDPNYGTNRCPHCGVNLFSSESLTAIEEKRKKENSAKKDE